MVKSTRRHATDAPVGQRAAGPYAAPCAAACARGGRARHRGVAGLARGRAPRTAPAPGGWHAGCPAVAARLDLTSRAEWSVDQRRRMTRRAGRPARTGPAGRAPAHHPTLEVHDRDYCPCKPGRGPAGPDTGDTRRPAGPGRPVTGVPGFPEDADRDGDVDVLYLAGQLPAGPEWLLITAVNGIPGAEFTARVLPAGGRHAHGGDVVVHLAAEPRAPGTADGPRRGVGRHVRAPGPGRGVGPSGARGWPEKIRATVAFAMGVLTELEEHGADLAAGRRVDLDDAAVTATAGIPADVTSALAGSGGLPGH